jgi:Mce-associated membrane protein
MAKHAAPKGGFDTPSVAAALDDDADAPETKAPAPADEPTPSAAPADEATTGPTDEAADDEVDEPVGRPWTLLRLATVAGLTVVLALAGLTGWLGYQAYQARADAQNRERFVEAGRQGALNLTSVDWQEADADVQRILDSATGDFYDQFQKRAKPYTEVVKEAKSKSVGTVQQAGLESVSGDSAKVLVAVSIATSNAGAPDQPLRYWRMRLTVDEVDGQMKVAQVEFVQ